MSGEKVCPMCGPTTVEQHPRQPALTRCANCKEWLARASTPVPSEVAETTAGEREVEALAKVLAAHVMHAGAGNHWYAECLSEECDWSEQGTGGLIHGIEAHRAHVATILAALLDRVRREEGERIAQAIEAKYLGPDSGRGYDGSEAPDAHCRNAYDEGLYDAVHIARAASVGPTD